MNGRKILIGILYAVVGFSGAASSILIAELVRLGSYKVEEDPRFLPIGIAFAIAGLIVAWAIVRFA